MQKSMYELYNKVLSWCGSSSYNVHSALNSNHDMITSKSLKNIDALSSITSRLHDITIIYDIKTVYLS